MRHVQVPGGPSAQGFRGKAAPGGRRWQGGDPGKAPACPQAAQDLRWEISLAAHLLQVSHPDGLGPMKACSLLAHAQRHLQGTK